MRWIVALLIVTLACKGSENNSKKQVPPGPVPTVPAPTAHAAPPDATPEQILLEHSPWAVAYLNKGDEPIEKLSIVEGDGARAGIVAEKYAHALAVRDWQIMCDQRMAPERAELAKGEASCADAYRKMLDGQPPSATEPFITLHAIAARRRGKLIAVDLDSPTRPKTDDPGPFMTLLLGREGDHWYLIDLPKSQDF